MHREPLHTTHTHTQALMGVRLSQPSRELEKGSYHQLHIAEKEAALSDMLAGGRPHKKCVTGLGQDPGSAMLKGFLFSM